MGFVSAPIQNFIGQGITFPLQLVKGAAPLLSGFDLIKSSIYTILSWQIGTRFLLTEFGSLVKQLLEEPTDADTANTLNIFVVDAIRQWEPRVEKVSCTMIIKSPTEIDLQITYQILGTQQPDSFVFPYFTTIIY